MAFEKIQSKLVAAQTQTISFILLYIRKPLSFFIILLLTILLVFKITEPNVGHFTLFGSSDDNGNQFINRLNLLDDDDPQLSVVPGNECTLGMIF